MPRFGFSKKRTQDVDQHAQRPLQFGDRVFLSDGRTGSVQHGRSFAPSGEALIDVDVGGTVQTVALQSVRPVGRKQHN